MDDRIDIRVPGADDPALLRAAATDDFDHPDRPDAARAPLNDAGHVRVAAISVPKIVGFARRTVIHHPDTAPQFLLGEVGAADDVHRRGVARETPGHLRKVVQDKGGDQVWVITPATNTVARALCGGLAGTKTADLVFCDGTTHSDAG